MFSRAHFFRRRSGRVAAPLTVAMMLVAAVLGFAPAAFAHHPELDGDVECVDGQQVITWSVTNWASLETNGVDRAMTIDQISVTSDPSIAGLSVTGFGVGSVFPPQPLPDSTQPGQTVVPGSATGWVELTVRADWNGGPVDQQRSVKVVLPAGCTLPADPSAAIAMTCEDDGPVFTLTNGGGESVTFTILKGDDVLAEVTVAAGDTATPSFPMAEDETATFSVEAPGMETVSDTLTRDCEQPGATIISNCVDGFVVTLTNDGEQTATFTVTRPDGTTEDVPVPGGESETRHYAIAEDATATVTVEADGLDTVSKTVTQDCQDPAATITSTCLDGVTITLTNTNGELPVTFTILKGDDVLAEVPVAAGATETPSFPLAEDETATFSVEAPGMDTVSDTLTRDCVIPNAGLAWNCEAGGVVATLVNDGELPTSFSVVKNGALAEEVVVAGGETVTRTYLLAEDESGVFQVSVGGLDSTPTLGFTHDCEAPPPPATEVLGITLTAPAPAEAAPASTATLPRTGIESRDAARLASALLIAGPLLLLAGRRRKGVA